MVRLHISGLVRRSSPGQSGDKPLVVLHRIDYRTLQRWYRLKWLLRAPAKKKSGEMADLWLFQDFSTVDPYGKTHI